MTRGTLVLVTDNGTFVSTEFNGDMYLEGHGRDALMAISEVETLEEFEKAVNDFNSTHHNYDDEQLIWRVQKSNDEVFDMTKDYYENWGSDYLYIKNASEKNLEWKDKEGESGVLCSGTTAVWNFGRDTYVDDGNIDEYFKLKKEFEELDDEDIIAILEMSYEDRICGIYEDYYDIGHEYAVMVNGIPDWLDDDRYINFEAIGRDTAENDSWFELPSGKFAYLC